MKSYTTRLLADFDQSPELRYVSAFAVSLLVASAIALAWLQSPAAPATARIPAPIVVLATAQPTVQPPTATPAPKPEVKELPSGMVVAYEAARGWYVLRDAPTPAPAVIVEDAPPVIQHEVVYQDAPPVLAQAGDHGQPPAPAAEPEAWQGVPFVDDACAAWHAPAVLPEGCQ